jgi:hypothetical protein
MFFKTANEGPQQPFDVFRPEIRQQYKELKKIMHSDPVNFGQEMFDREVAIARSRSVR